jgi:glucose/arabinose dehydrogenase
LNIRSDIGTGCATLSCLLIACAAAIAQELPVNWQGLPEPYATPSARNPPQMVPRPPGAALSLPAGFGIEEWATGLYGGPREMILGPDGEVLISQMGGGSVTAVRNGERKDVLQGLNGPFGLAMHENWLYVAEIDSVKRYRYDAAAMSVGEAEEIIDLRAVNGGHVTRAILFDPGHDYLYISIGSGSNVDAGEPPIRAAINRYDADGGSHSIFASGIRNAVGMDWNPVTGDLWVSAHERDGLGDDLVPDYLTRVQEGGFYGWPYAYIGPHEDPRRKGEAPDLVKKTLYPDVLLGGHVGAMDVLFYTANQFPARYRNGAFVALHGSWNRSKRTGYKIVFVPFKDGRPAAGPEDFVSGWMLGEDRREVWGRPVGLLQMPDGSMLISDEGPGTIWRVTYDAKR